MITVYKYQFEFAEEITIELPASSYILSIQMQDGKPSLWARVDTDNEVVPYKFECYWTGQAIVDVEKLGFIATVQANEGLVWHVFQRYIAAE
jgi:hypothetical protein